MIRALLGVALVVLAWLAPPTAAEDDSWNRAGLVVRHGDGRVVYAYVAFSEPSISGIELLRRSGIPLVTVGFGALGEGVCSVAGEGCGVNECRQRVCQGAGANAPFWQYLRQSAPGAGDWRFLSLGGSATRVRDGDIDCWSWTGGDPGLPPLTLADVARLAGVPANGGAGAGGSLPTPAVREEVPAGYVRDREDDGDRQGMLAYVATGAVLAAMAGVLGAVVARNRRARGTGVEEAA